MDDLTVEELAGLTPEEIALLMDDDTNYVSDGSDDLGGGGVGNDTGIPLPDGYGDGEDDGSFPLPADYRQGDELPGSGGSDGDGVQSWDAKGMFDAPPGSAPFEDLGSDESGDSDTERFNEAAKAKARLNTNIGSDGDSDGVDNDEDFFLRAAQQSKKSKKKTSKGGKKKKKVGGGYQVNQGGSGLMDDLTAAPPPTSKDRGKGKGKGKGKAKPALFDPDDDEDSDWAAADDSAAASDAPTAPSLDGGVEDSHAAEASAATPSPESPELLGVPLAFLPFVAGKTVVGGSVKMFPGASNTFQLPEQLIEAFWASGRRVARPDTLPDPKAGDAASDSEDDGAGPTVFVDVVRFSDGSAYVDSGGKPRYKPNPDEEADPTELEAAGMKEHGGYFLWAGPPPAPLSPLPEHDGGGDDDGVVLSKKDKRKAKKKAKEVRTAEALVTQAAAAAGGDELACQICGKQFDTRNKLFQHIKQTGHAMLIADANNRAKEKRKKKAATTRSKNTSFRSF